MKNKSVAALVLAMLIYGTIGIFRSYLPGVPSSMLAMVRGVVGSAFLGIVMLISKKKINTGVIKKNFSKLLASGIMLGFNWVLLFEAYRYTSVSVATLCYYMAPVFITLASPIFLGEKLSLKKCICIFAALFGMALVSGVFDGENSVSAMGVFLGIFAAILYAAIVILNKKTAGVSAYEKTFIQLLISAVVMLIYTLMTEDISKVQFTPLVIILLIIVGVVHTGIAYTLYFGSIGKLNAQTAALLSYIDPVSAIILSAVILGESMTLFGIIGSVLILGSAIVGEVGNS